VFEPPFLNVKIKNSEIIRCKLENKSDKYEEIDVSKLKEVYGSYFSYAIESESLMAEDKKIIEILGNNISQRFFTIEQLEQSYIKLKKSEIKLVLEELDDYYEGNKLRFSLAEKNIGTKETKKLYKEYLEEKNLCQNAIKELGNKKLDVTYLTGKKTVHKDRLIPKQIVYVLNDDLNNLYIKEGIVSEVFVSDSEWVHINDDRKADVYFRYTILEADGREYKIESENAANFNKYFGTNNFTRKIFLNYEDALEHLESSILKGISRLNGILNDVQNYRDN
jgi:hypothetical protein